MSRSTANTPVDGWPSSCCVSAELKLRAATPYQCGLPVSSNSSISAVRCAGALRRRNSVISSTNGSLVRTWLISRCARGRKIDAQQSFGGRIGEDQLIVLIDGDHRLRQPAQNRLHLQLPGGRALQTHFHPAAHMFHLFHALAMRAEKFCKCIAPPDTTDWFAANSADRHRPRPAQISPGRSGLMRCRTVGRQSVAWPRAVPTDTCMPCPAQTPHPKSGSASASSIPAARSARCPTSTKTRWSKLPRSSKRLCLSNRSTDEFQVDRTRTT